MPVNAGFSACPVKHDCRTGIETSNIFVEAFILLKYSYYYYNIIITRYQITVYTENLIAKESIEQQ